MSTQESIYAGDTILLKVHTGKYIDVQGEFLQACSSIPTQDQMIIIEKMEPGPISAGDTVFLKMHTGKHIDVQGQSVQATWSDLGHWQQMIIETHTSGRIYDTDEIFLRTHTGNHIDVGDQSVQARWDDHGPWQKLTIHKVFKISLDQVAAIGDVDFRDVVQSRLLDSESESQWEFADTGSPSIRTEDYEAVQAEHLGARH